MARSPGAWRRVPRAFDAPSSGKARFGVCSQGLIGLQKAIDGGRSGWRGKRESLSLEAVSIRNQRFITVQCNVVDRDIGSFVAEGEAAIDRGVDLPPGYLVT